MDGILYVLCLYVTYWWFSIVMNGGGWAALAMPFSIVLCAGLVWLVDNFFGQTRNI